MTRIGIVKVLATVIMLAAAKGWAGPDYGPKFWSPTEEVVTPHITWAKPDAQGPLKVLFIVARSGMREVVELAQRMELQYTVFAVGSGSRDTRTGANDFCSKDYYDPDRARDSDVLTEDLKARIEESYDLIAIGKVNWNSLPLIIRYRLLKKVKEGTPLVGAVAQPDDYFKRAAAKKEKLDLPALIPFKGLPAFAQHKDAAAWLNAAIDYAEFGKGKILTFKGFDIPEGLQLFTPGPAGNLLEAKLVEYDYYLAWVIHLMRFAAGRPAVRVAGSDYVAADRRGLTNVEYLVSGTEGKAVTCAFILRNDDNQVVGSQEKEIKLSAAGAAVRFEFPPAPAGRYFGDVWVKEGGKVWTFGSSFLELSGDPAIESVELRKDYRREEKVTGKVRLTARKAADGSAPAKSGMKLVFRQRDTYGRVTAQSQIEIPAFRPGQGRAGQPCPAALQEVSFELAGSQPLTIVQYLEVELQKGEEILDRKTKAFSISDIPPKDDVRLIGWCDAWRSYAVYHKFAEFAKAGFDTQYSPQEFLEIQALYNIRSIPYKTRLIGNEPSGSHVRSPCLTDLKYLKGLADLLTKTAESVKPFSATEFSLGDECAFSRHEGDLCFSPTCAAGFHKFLASEYRTVEAMNREYGTQYKSFDEVQPIALDEARKTKTLQPLWVDFRRQMENTWAGIFPYCAEVVGKIVPSAKVGYEGSDTRITSWQAADFYKLMKAMRLNGTYDGAFVPYAVMSFAQPGTLLGLGWYGGYNGGGRTPEYQRYIAWRHLFRGANSFWVWENDACGTGDTRAPDLSLYDFFKSNTAELREIKSGIGKLLMAARRDTDGIAILYSASSVHVSTLTEGLPSLERVLNSLVPLFEDTGRQFGIVSYEQVAEGELKKGGYKVLWMPYVQALAPKEAAEIESFVREGGTVIADLRPGVRDEHGKPYADGGVLDKVFGVKQRTEGPLATNCSVTINLEGWSKTLKKAACDWSISLGTGKAQALLAGEKPAWIANRYEKGKALLLNFSISDYAEVAGSLEKSAVKVGDDSGAIRDLFKALMTQAGVDDPVKVEPEIAGARLYRFVKDGLAYLGVLQGLPEPADAYLDGSAKTLIARPGVLKLCEKKYIYDARQGKYLGYSDRIETAIEPAKGLLFALLPYEVKGVRVSASKHIRQGEDLEYKAAIEGTKNPGLHVFHVELTSPKGENVSYYADNVVGEGGKCQGLISLALNEAVGKWKLRVRDVATGMTVEHAFVVEERK